MLKFFERSCALVCCLVQRWCELGSCCFAGPWGPCQPETTVLVPIRQRFDIPLPGEDVEKLEDDDRDGDSNWSGPWAPFHSFPLLKKHGMSGNSWCRLCLSRILLESPHTLAAQRTGSYVPRPKGRVRELPWASTPGTSRRTDNM